MNIECKGPFKWGKGKWGTAGLVAGVIVGGLALFSAFALVLSFVVQWLWNWLMPALFNLPTISYWQALGLMVLSHLLLKGFHGGESEKHKHHHKESVNKDALAQDIAKRVRELLDDERKGEGDPALPAP